jgi:hypothetical protein
LNALRGLQRGITPTCDGAWLLKIAENVCLTRQRSSLRRRRVETPGDLITLQAVTAAPAPDTDELLGLSDALGAMSEQQRRALLLREWQGLTYREIGAELDLSQAAVETLLFRARRSLAHGLEAPKPSGLRKRLRAGIEAGSLWTFLKGLLFGSGAKVAATVATVAVASVAAAPTVAHQKTEAPEQRPVPAATSRPAPSQPPAAEPELKALRKPSPALSTSTARPRVVPPLPPPPVRSATLVAKRVAPVASVAPVAPVAPRATVRSAPKSVLTAVPPAAVDDAPVAEAKDEAKPDRPAKKAIVARAAKATAKLPGKAAANLPANAAAIPPPKPTAELPATAPLEVAQPVGAVETQIDAARQEVNPAITSAATTPQAGVEVVNKEIASVTKEVPTVTKEIASVTKEVAAVTKELPAPVAAQVSALSG